VDSIEWGDRDGEVEREKRSRETASTSSHGFFLSYIDFEGELIVRGKGWLFSSFLLKNKIFIAYLMAIILSCDTIGSIMFLGSEKTRLSSDIVFLWVLPLAPVVSVISGSTFQPLALMLLIKPKYLSVFSWILSREYLSL
jgi:hypothetical protein